MRPPDLCLCEPRPSYFQSISKVARPLSSSISQFTAYFYWGRGGGVVEGGKMGKKGGLVVVFINVKYHRPYAWRVEDKLLLEICEL